MLLHHFHCPLLYAFATLHLRLLLPMLEVAVLVAWLPLLLPLDVPSARPLAACGYVDRCVAIARAGLHPSLRVQLQ